MQRPERAHRYFPRYSSTPGRRGLAFLLLVFALMPQLLSIGAWDGYGSAAQGAAVQAAETAADGAPAGCELGSVSCAAAATAAAASAAILAPLLLLAVAAAPARRRPGASSRLPAFAIAPRPQPPRSPFLPR